MSSKEYDFDLTTIARVMTHRTSYIVNERMVTPLKGTPPRKKVYVAQVEDTVIICCARADGRFIVQEIEI